MRKSLFFVLFLAFASLIFAKTYPITFEKATKVGNVQLAKGEYDVKLDGERLLFVDQKDRTFAVPVKVINDPAKKFPVTTVEASEKDGVNVIKVIHLGGSTTSVEFTN